MRISSKKERKDLSQKNSADACMLNAFMLRRVFNLEPKDLLPLTRRSSSSRILRSPVYNRVSAEELATSFDT